MAVSVPNFGSLSFFIRSGGRVQTDTPTCKQPNKKKIYSDCVSWMNLKI